MVKIKTFPARYGDCFLISIQDLDQKINILVDGGIAKTYNSTLKQELVKIAAQGEEINLAICTHIDLDHINGLIALLKENNEKRFIDINEVWHNGLEQITTKYPATSDKPINQTDIKIIDTINQKGYEDEFQETENVGVVEGISLASLIEFGEIRHNHVSNGKAINDQLKVIELSPNVKIRIVNPSQSKLSALEEEWINELFKRNFKFSIPKSLELVSSFEFLIARIKKFYQQEKINICADAMLENYLSELNNIDTSVVNDSSISFVLEVYDKKFLFLGDAILKEEKCSISEKISLHYGSDGSEIMFDVIKLPHHGSRYNISKNFISKFKAREYIVSSDSSRFDHPDIDVLANIIIKNKDYHKVLVFNYPIEKAKLLKNTDWQANYQYSLIIGDGISSIERSY